MTDLVVSWEPLLSQSFYCTEICFTAYFADLSLHISAQVALVLGSFFELRGNAIQL